MYSSNKEKSYILDIGFVLRHKFTLLSFNVKKNDTSIYKKEKKIKTRVIDSIEFNKLDQLKQYE